MAGVSATHLILFVASLVIAVGVTGVLVGEVGRLSGAIEDRGSGVTEEIETDVVIISDEARSDAIYDGDDVTILVKNVGSRELQADPRVIDVLVDGAYIPNDELTVDRVDTDGAGSWRPGGVIAVTATDSEVHGDTDITVVVSGNEDTIDIHV